jgi:hypothetical protein
MALSPTPEDEVVAPLYGLHGMREGKDVGADTFGVDGDLSLRGYPLPLHQ